MLQQPIRKTFDIGDGRMVTIETGRLARQADGGDLSRVDAGAGQEGVVARGKHSKKG